MLFSNGGTKDGFAGGQKLYRWCAIGWKGQNMLMLYFFSLRRTIKSACKVLSDGVPNNGCEKFPIVGG